MNKPSKPRDLRRAVGVVESYFGTGSKEPCRAHFRNVVAFVASNCPDLIPGMLAASGMTQPQVDMAMKGQRTGAAEIARIAAGRSIFEQAKARVADIQIDPLVAAKIGVTSAVLAMAA